MALKENLLSEVSNTFKNQWTTRDGRVVPEAGDVKLGNDAIKLTGVVLYADLAESTNMVRSFPDYFSAEVYKAYLTCASKIINYESGVITAFDGDRVMAVYIGDNKETRAMRTALKISYAVQNIINPKMLEQYGSTILSGKVFRVKQAVGIDSSELYIARTGVRGSNDLVWVGNSANNAAKLCGLRNGSYASWITKEVYDAANNSIKVYDNRNVWESATWDGKSVYKSSWTWEV